MISTGQGTITPSSGTVIVCPVPAGPGYMVLTNSGTQAIYVGATTNGATITTASAMPIPSGGILPVTLLPGAGSTYLKAVTAAGTAVCGYLVSTSYGLPQAGQQ